MYGSNTTSSNMHGSNNPPAISISSNSLAMGVPVSLDQLLKPVKSRCLYYSSYYLENGSTFLIFYAAQSAILAQNASI